MTNRKIFLIGDAAALANVPFGDLDWLRSLSMEIVEDVADADIVAARSLQTEVKQEHVAANRLVVTWTHEPKWDWTPAPLVRNYLGGSDAYVFNVYNTNIYTDNFFYAPIGRPLPELTKASFDAGRLEKAMIGVFATYRRKPMVVRGVDYALDELRGGLAMGLHGLGRCTVHGLGWPKGVAVGESRSSDRNRTKLSGLGAFPYSLCCENTDFDYYVTEKLWQCLQGGALPLYWPNRTLSTAFPQESFIDLRQSNARTPEEIVNIIDNLSTDEYIARMNACIKVYNDAAKGGWRHAARGRSRELLANVLRFA